MGNRREELSKAQRIKDPAEKEARIAELEREGEYENVANLPDPVLYPIDPATRISSITADSSEKARSAKKNDLSSILYDEYEDDRQAQMDCDDDNGRDEDGDDTEDGICTGIPHFPLIMRVDIQGKFGKEKSVMAFHSKFGSLPVRAMLDLTEMMYRPHMKKKKSLIRKRKHEAAVAAGLDPDVYGADNDDGKNEGLLPEDIFLPEPEIVQAYRRLKMFKPDEFTMDAFRKAGCDAHLLNRIMGVVRNAKGMCFCFKSFCFLPKRAFQCWSTVASNTVFQTSAHADYHEKFELFNDYLERIVRQHISGILNNDLRSSHALFTAKYVEQAKDDVCGDLRALITKVSPGFYNFMKKDKIASQVAGKPVYRVKEEAYAQEAVSPSFWHLNSSNTFISYR